MFAFTKMASQDSLLDQGLMQGGSKASPELAARSRTKLLFEPLAVENSGDQMRVTNLKIDTPRMPDRVAPKPVPKSNSQDKYATLPTRRDSHSADVGF